MNFYINNEPTLFSKESVEKIEKLKDAEFVCETEKNDIHVAIFYGKVAHPVSNSRYFGLYFATHTNELMITDGSFVEDQEIYGVVSCEGEIIYSRYRHDYRHSKDGSVFIDGGRSYIRTNTMARQVVLKVKDGKFINTTPMEQVFEKLLLK